MADFEKSISKIRKRLTKEDEAIRYRSIVRLRNKIVASNPDEVRQHLKTLVKISKRSLGDTSDRVRGITATAIIRLTTNHGLTPVEFEVLSPLLKPLWRAMACDSTRTAVRILIALHRLVSIVDQEDRIRIFAGELLWGLRFLLDRHGIEERITVKAVLYILGECVRVRVHGEEIDSSLKLLLPGFVKKFWIYGVVSALDPDDLEMLFKVTAEITERLGSPTVRGMIDNELLGEEVLGRKDYMAGVMKSYFCFQRNVRLDNGGSKERRL